VTVGSHDLKRAAYLAILGPPAVGKTTLTSMLAALNGGQVFRLREFARYHARHHSVGAAPIPDDPLGWLPDSFVSRLLHFAFLEGGFRCYQRAILLENFPGNAYQAQRLGQIVRCNGGCLGALELCATDDIVGARAAERRVCPTCESDPDGDPHNPARARAHASSECVVCGGALRSRQGDDGERFSMRLHRYRANVSRIRDELANQGAIYRQVDVVSDIDECLVKAQRLLNELDARR
jgi:adenylate kinase family enzyme